MRWLVVHPGPHFSVADVYRGWCEGLAANGETVIEYNLGDRLNAFGYAHIEVDEVDGLKRFRRMYSDEQVKQLAVEGLSAKIFTARPDVLLIISGFFIPHDLLDYIRRRGVGVIVLHTESPYEDERQLALAQHADLNLINDPVNIETFREAAPTFYLPHAYRPEIHHPGLGVPELKSDFAFVGTGYPSRIAFFEQLDLTGVDALFGGNWQQLAEDSPLRPFVANELETCLANDKAADVYRSTKISINTYRREAQHPDLSDGVAIGPREVELAACGTFFLREPRPEGDELWPQLPRFATPAEATALIRWYLDRPALREEAARAAREAVADRTFTKHAAALLRRVVL